MDTTATIGLAPLLGREPTDCTCTLFAQLLLGFSFFQVLDLQPDFTPSELETSGTRVGGLDRAEALGFLRAAVAVADMSSREAESWLLFAVFSFEELALSVFRSLLSRRCSLGADMVMESTCWLLRLLLRWRLAWVGAITRDSPSPTGRGRRTLVAALEPTRSRSDWAVTTGGTCGVGSVGLFRLVFGASEAGA